MMSHIFICRTDNLARIEDFLKTMCAPSRNTCNCENWCKQLFGDSKHSIYETTVKVYVCADIFEKSPLFHDHSSCQTFYQFVKGKFFHHSLLLCKVSGKTFQDYFTRIRKCINSMSHTIDQTGMIECFFIQNLAEICFYLFLICPVFDIRLDILKHVLYLKVCTTMTRSFERTDRCCNRRISICSGRSNYVCRKSRVVTTTMLCMKDQGNIKYFRLQFCVFAIRSKHQKDVFCKPFLWITDKQSLITTEMSVGMIGIYCNQRQFCDHFNALAKNIFRRNIFWFGIIGVQSENTSLHCIHDITVGSFHNNVTHKTSGQSFKVFHDIFEYFHIFI